MQSGGLLAAFAGGEGWPSVVRAARAAHAVVIPAVAVWRRTPVPEGGTIEVRFGAPLPQERLSGFAADRDAGHYLRWRTNLVAWRHEAPVRLVPRLAR
jgi:hypothetical protein